MICTKKGVLPYIIHLSVIRDRYLFVKDSDDDGIPDDEDKCPNKACSILKTLMDTDSYKCTKQKLTQICCVSGGSIPRNPMFRRKLTQNIH